MVNRKRKLLMRTYLLFFSAALLLAGCSKENLVPTDGNENQNGKLHLSFTASQAGFGTKTVIGETTTDGEGHKSTSINWQQSDTISLFDGARANCKFGIKDFSSETTTNCTFEGKVTEYATDYTAVYPYTEAATIAEGVISGVTLPATQTAVEGSFDAKAALMAAKTVDGGRELAFQNLVGYVKITPDFDCKQIELCAASGERLAGSGSITFDAEGNPSFALAEGAGSTIALIPDGESTLPAGKTYYIAVPEEKLAAGWSLAFTMTNDIVYHREGVKEIQLKKNTVINLGSIKMDDIIPYVTFSAENAQRFTMSLQPDPSIAAFTLGEGEYFEYRVGKGEWQRFTTTVSDIAFGGSGNDLQLRGISSKGTAVSNSTQWTTISFGETSVQVACSGDIRTLVDYRNHQTVGTSAARFCYLFKDCRQLTSPPDLPATVLSDYCYYEMFKQCLALASAPALPATNLENFCYQRMFSFCNALTSAPALPATNLAMYCYQGMFESTSLTSAPQLPATTLAPNCYDAMFANCIKLESAPALPATNLADYCYKDMFSNCESLFYTPELPATVLSYGCYLRMFNGCRELGLYSSDFYCMLPAETTVHECYREMFYGCVRLSKIHIKAKYLGESDYGGEYDFKNWLYDAGSRNGFNKVTIYGTSELLDIRTNKYNNWGDCNVDFQVTY